MNICASPNGVMRASKINYSLTTLRKPSVMFLASTPAENVQLGEEQTNKCRRPGSAAVVRIVTSLSGSRQCGQLFFISNLGTGFVMARPPPVGNESVSRRDGSGDEMVA